jgi:hypothetical protein
VGKTFLAGGLVLVAIVVLLLFDGLLGLGLGTVFLGAGIGGALGLVNEPSTLIGRLGGFLIGFVLAMVIYPLRALYIPDNVTGRFVQAIVVVGLVTVVCALTKNRLPLWAGLLGIAAVVGSYEAAFASAPQNVLSELLPYSSKVLLTVSFTFLLAGIANVLNSRDEAVEVQTYPNEDTTQYSEVR